MNIGWLLLLVFFCLILLSVLLAAISLAPFVPARKRDIKRIIELADLKPGEIFYDLGCGDGRVVLAAGEAGTKAVGIELAWPVYFYCEIRKILKRAENVSFRFGDFFHQDISEADVVYFFGTPAGITEKLKDKLKKELKPGARVVSYTFPVKGWSPAEVNKPNEEEVAIYVYTINN